MRSSVASRLAIPLALAVLLTSCASSLSMTEYASSIEAATTSYVEETQVLGVAFHQSVEDEVEAIVEKREGDLAEQAARVAAQETVQYLVLLEDAMSRYIDHLAPMRAPGEVADAHDAYVAALDSVRGAMPATREGVAAADGLEAIETAITASGFGDGQPRLRAACESLVDAVASQGQHIDLGCSATVQGI